MRGEQAIDIEGLDLGKQPIPDDGDQQWGHNELRKARRGIAGELASCHCLAGDGAHQRYAGRNHLAVIEGSNGGKAWSFGDDQAQQQLAVGAQHLLAKKGKKQLEDLRGPHIGGQRRRAHPIHDRGHGTAHELLKQVLLVLEVEIERAFGDAGLGRHVIEPRRLVAAGRKHR